MSVYVETTCMPPFVNVMLTCDICGSVTTNCGSWQNTRQHVVELKDGRTICKQCFAENAKEQDSVD